MITTSLSPAEASVVAASVSAVAVSLTAWLNVYISKRRNKVEEIGTLSTAESAFRKDIMSRLTEVTRRLDDCEARHRERDEKEENMRCKVDRQTSRIAELEGQIHSLNQKIQDSRDFIQW